MLMLLFYVGSDLYALDSSQVVEIIPMVNLRKIPQVPNHVAGSFQYRGAIVPAIDLCQLIQGTASVPYLSTRIIILNCRQWNRNPSNKSNASPMIGTIAQQVTETIKISETDIFTPVMFSDHSPYLGETIMDNHGTIQLIRMENLLVQSLKSLLPESEATA